MVNKKWNIPKIINHELLQIPRSEAEAISLQMKWRSWLDQIFHKKIKLDPECDLIAGVDVSYPQVSDPKWGIACVTTWQHSTNQYLTPIYTKGEIKFPYIPGLLGFRECSLIVDALLQLPKQPDLILCDGHGLIHPRKFGEAIQLGLILDIPTIGIAKNPFVGQGDWKSLSKIRGEKTSILFKNELVGYAVCLSTGHKPVFVSPGYQISLENAYKNILSIPTQYRQPDLLHYADQLSRKEIQKKMEH